MGTVNRAMEALWRMEALTDRDTPIHRRHPLCHLVVTLGYIVVLSSFGKYELDALLPFLFYPLAVMALGELPVGYLLRQGLPALPIVFFLGAFNPVLDHSTVILLGHRVSAGWLSLSSLIARGALSVTAALALAGVAGMTGISRALRLLRVPQILVTQLLFTYRYLFVLGGEAERMWLAYSLRAPGQRGVAFRQWGSFAGQWLLRSLGRAEHIHAAMLCRGFTGEMPAPAPRPFGWADGLYIAGWIALFLAARAVNLPLLLGTLLTGGA